MNFVRFLKDFTLPLAMGAGTIIYLIFAFTPALSDAADFFSPIMDTIFPVFMVCILFVTFCKVDFHKMRPRPWHLFVGIGQVVLVAAITALMLAMGWEGNAYILAASALACIIAPTAAAAAVITTKLGGNLEDMTTYTFISNFISALLVPICFPLIAQTGDLSFWSTFVRILWKVSLILILPMALAYCVRHFIPALHRKIVGVKDLSFYLWGISLSIVTGMTIKHIVHADTTVGFILLVAVVSLIVCVLQFAVGRLIGKHFGCPIDVGQALGQKNTAFAIWIAYTYLNPLTSVGPGCYILWQNIINSVEIVEQDRKGKLRSC